MLMRKYKSKSKSALCCMKWVCRDWHYGRVHLTNRRHLLVQNACKWKGKLFCRFYFFIKMLVRVFKESCCLCVPRCQALVGQWGHGNGSMSILGSGATVSALCQLGCRIGLRWRCCLPKLGDAEVLPLEGFGLLWLEQLSLGKWGYLGWSIMKRYKSSHVQQLHLDFHPLLSLLLYNLSYPPFLPPPDGLGGEQPRPLCWKHQLGSLEAAAPVDMKDLGHIWYQVNAAQPN